MTLCLDPNPGKTVTHSHSDGQKLLLQFGPIALVQERALDSGLPGYRLASPVFSCVAGLKKRWRAHKISLRKHLQLGNQKEKVVVGPEGEWRYWEMRERIRSKKWKTDLNSTWEAADMSKHREQGGWTERRGTSRWGARGWCESVARLPPKSIPALCCDSCG